MKAVVAAFNQEKALVGAFSVITNLRICFGWNFLKHYQLLTVRRVAHLRGVRPLAAHRAAGRQLPPRPRPRPRLLLGLQLAAHRGHLLVGEGRPRPRPRPGLAILAVLLLGARLADLLVPVPGILPRGGLRVVVDEVTAISFV